MWDNVQAMLDHVPHALARRAGAGAARRSSMPGCWTWRPCLARELDLFRRRMVEVAKALVGGRA